MCQLVGAKRADLLRIQADDGSGLAVTDRKVELGEDVDGFLGTGVREGFGQLLNL